MTENIIEFPKDKDMALTLRVTPRSNDANPKGDIFGGWLMSQMDIAGAVVAIPAAKGSVSTVAVKELRFINPLYAFDIVSFFAKVTHVGTTSVTVALEVYAQRHFDISNTVIKISEAVFVYVAVSNPGIKREIPK